MQAVLLMVGGLTVACGQEFPSRLLQEWQVELMLPGGKVQADLLIKTRDPSGVVKLDISILEPMSAGSLEWYDRL